MAQDEVGIFGIRTLRALAKGLKSLTEDRKEDEAMAGFGASKEEIAKDYLDKQLRLQKEKRLDGDGVEGYRTNNDSGAKGSSVAGVNMDGSVQEVMGEVGALFRKLRDDIKENRAGRAEDKAERIRGGGGGIRSSGKGRHDDVSLTRPDGGDKSAVEIRKELGLNSKERLDTVRVFQAANGKGSFKDETCLRKGFEIKMGFGVAILAITTLNTGPFTTSQPNETFEIQNLYVSHNGDGASAAATIAIHYTLLAHIAVASFKVGDDVLITAANYVPYHGYCGPDDMAGYVTSFTEPLALTLYNGAGYTANLLAGAGGEGVVKIS